MTLSAFDDQAGIRAQFATWGYALTGNICETAAMIAEGEAELVRGGAWDRSPGLARALIAHGDEPYRPVKDFAALPWATEHILRGHADWPGL